MTYKQQPLPPAPFIGASTTILIYGKKISTIRFKARLMVITETFLLLFIFFVLKINLISRKRHAVESLICSSAPNFLVRAYNNIIIFLRHVSASRYYIAYAVLSCDNNNKKILKIKMSTIYIILNLTRGRVVTRDISNETVLLISRHLFFYFLAHSRRISFLGTTF